MEDEMEKNFGPNDQDRMLPVQSRLLLYRTEDGRTRVEVLLQDESVWLNQSAMAELFQSSKQNISLHLKNIFNEGELAETRVVKEYLTTAADGKNYRTKFYNMEAIIAVGYRGRSHRGTQFRRWATERLNEYLVKGFTMDDERLKAVRNIGSDYFDELLERFGTSGPARNGLTRKSAISISWPWITTPRPRRPSSFSASSRTSCISPLRAKPPQS